MVAIVTAVTEQEKEAIVTAHNRLVEMVEALEKKLEDAERRIEQLEKLHRGPHGLA